MVLMVAKMYGWLIALLGVLGLFVTDGHLFKLMNADMPLDILRLVLATTLLWAAYGKKEDIARNALLLVGVLYVGMGIAALFDPELWGLLPTGLTGFDVIFHLVTGLAALGVAKTKLAVDSVKK
jgi:hypothetical protein